MIRLPLASCAAALMVMSSMAADIPTFSLGNLDQYSLSLKSTPTLTGSSLTVTDAPSGDGVDVIFSQGLRDSIQKIVDTDCKTDENKCMTKLQNLITTSPKNMQARQVAIPIIAGLELSNLILGFQAMDPKPLKVIPIGHHIPNKPLKDYAGITKTPTVAIAAPEKTLTLTQNPPPAPVTENQKPEVTTFTDSKNGHKAGDVVISLPNDVASRIEDMVRMSDFCPDIDGANRDSKKKKRACGPEVAAIGGAQNIMINLAGPAAVLAGIHANVNFRDAGAARALRETMAWARNQAAALQVSAAVAEQMGAAAYYLAWLVNVKNQHLGENNTLSEGDLTSATKVPTGSITSTSVKTTSSKSTGPCTASCAMTGMIQMCHTKCPTATSGAPPKGTSYAVVTATVIPWKIPTVKEQYIIKDTLNVCLQEDTQFPRVLMKKTYQNFCKDAESSPGELTWTVDATGLRVKQRDTTYKTEDYMGYNITLLWKPTDSEVMCSKSCEDALGDLINQDDCGHRGNSKDFMATGGSADVGCGQFSFGIQKPPVKAQVWCRTLPFDSAPKEDKDASGGISVRKAINDWCGSHDNKRVSKSSGSADNTYDRFDITKLNVSKRASFWLRASLRCGESSDMKKDECVAAMTQGLEQCDAGNSWTTGWTANIGCLDYSLDLGGMVNDNNPPWKEEAEYPAPEFAKGKDTNGQPNRPVCISSRYWSTDPVSNDHLEQAFASFCVEGASINGLYQGADFPPDNQEGWKFEPELLDYRKRLLMAADIDAMTPYENMDYCNGFDRKLHKDDCIYAMRNMLKMCNTHDGKFVPSTFIYRCVNYRMAFTNYRKNA